jgi:1,4-alpha-glucan branching enzyme
MIKKQYLKSRPICKVTFTMPADAAQQGINLVGDFNNWDHSATPMEQLKDGRFKAVLELEKGREYQFLYLVDGEAWHNDAEADRQEPNPYQGQNSVLVV